MTDYGTLTDHITGEAIRPATAAELAPSPTADETGVFTIDRDGEPCPADADVTVFGPLRNVFVEGGSAHLLPDACYVCGGNKHDAPIEGHNYCSNTEAETYWANQPGGPAGAIEARYVTEHRPY